MIIIANKRIPENKRISVSLTYIYGIGKSLANKIIKNSNVENKKVNELDLVEGSRVIRETEKYIIEDKLREKIFKDKAEKIRLGTYQGRRMEQGLPIHGQSTRHNSRTAKRLRGSFRSEQKKIKSREKSTNPKTKGKKIKK